MVAIPVPPWVAPPILLASAHGVADVIVHDGRKLAVGYALPVLLVPDSATTPLFLVASVAHFAKDACGVLPSAAMHVVFLGLAAQGMSGAAWALFAVFYCGVHAPHAIAATWHRRRGGWLHPRAPRAATSAAVGAVLVVAFFALAARCAWSSEGFVAAEWQQRVVLAHACVNGMWCGDTRKKT